MRMPTRSMLMLLLFLVGVVLVVEPEWAFAQAGPITTPPVVEVRGYDLALIESTTDAIRAPLECDFGPTSRYPSPANTLKRALLYWPDGGVYEGFSRWNEMKISNITQANTAVNCGVGFLDAGTAPDCAASGWGDPIYRQGDSVTYVVTELQEVWCIACGGTATLTVTVSLCAP